MRACAPGADLATLYEFACAKIEFLQRELERNLSRPSVEPPAPFEVRAHQTQAEFEVSVRSIQEDITAGEIYQAVLSQRFDVSTSASPFDVYRALRHINPSPYMFFIRMGPEAIVGASPEMLVRVEGTHLETHPIAGTRRRGATPADDERLSVELQENEKERAEHVMLVDLGRNDIGRVAAVGQRPRAAVHDGRALLARHAPRLACGGTFGGGTATGSTRSWQRFPPVP
jgi:anthranilate synthase component 1